MLLTDQSITEPQSDTSSTTHANPFDDLPRTPDAHFKLYFLAAVAHLTRQVVQTFGTHEGAFNEYPFLRGYDDEIAGREPDGLSDDAAATWWAKTLHGWEQTTTHLPLRALRETCELTHTALTLLMCIGLVEEDARFGLLCEALHGAAGQHRPTIGLLNAWWHDATGYATTRANLRRLNELGLIQFVNTDAPRSEWTAQTQSVLWSIMRGETHAIPANWMRYHPLSALLDADELIVSNDVRQQLKMLPKVFTTGDAQTLIVRGHRSNGRRTLTGALARSLGKGMLEINAFERKDDERWRVVMPLAVLLRALPVIVCDVAPGETFELPDINLAHDVLGVTLGKQGGVSGTAVESVITLTLEMPDESARRSLWQRGFGSRETQDLSQVSERFRLTSGNIRRAARLAISYAALDERECITIDDVQNASRVLNHQTLDTLAARVNTQGGSWNHLAVRAETMRELQSLKQRCQGRERLRGAVGVAFGEQLNTGVRALFSGASGTGKTLAARLLAAELQMDLYRLDLSTVVNKYIGETEKNLARIFARVEELDVILLIDEGDALLTQRTNISNSNDRYANLETNYLLQRLESFEGILIITTNANDRIDGAFQRRMDIVVDFAAPDAQERWLIWQIHLPESHAIPSSLLDELARRCELTGGQIRNAVLHASTLALNQSGIVGGAHLEAAVQREYRKIGAVCPLRVNAASLSLKRTFDRW
ncbi:MAG: hypothetical protein NVSMB56_17500 [Pyrinomonadaceae bacterium]